MEEVLPSPNPSLQGRGIRSADPDQRIFVIRQRWYALLSTTQGGSLNSECRTIFLWFGLGSRPWIAACGDWRSLGQGRAAAGALEGMARQPELAGTIRTGMIIALAFIELLVIYALLMFFLLQGKLPDTNKMIEAGNNSTVTSTVAPAR